MTLILTTGRSQVGEYAPKRYNGRSNINNDGQPQESMGWATADRATDADQPGPISTGNPATNPDHPLMRNMRGGWPRAAAAMDFFE